MHRFFPARLLGTTETVNKKGAGRTFIHPACKVLASLFIRFQKNQLPALLLSLLVYQAAESTYFFVALNQQSF